MRRVCTTWHSWRWDGSGTQWVNIFVQEFYYRKWFTINVGFQYFPKKTVKQTKKGLNFSPVFILLMMQQQKWNIQRVIHIQNDNLNFFFRYAECFTQLWPRDSETIKDGKRFLKTELNVLTNCLCQSCNVLKICTSLIPF